MEKFILERIENAFKSEIDKEVAMEKLNTGNIVGLLENLEYYENGLIQDVKGDLIEYIKEELREVEFPGELNGFDYEIKYSSKALIEYLEQKEKSDLENEILENLKRCPNHSYADVDLFILESRILKYKDEIIGKIKNELLEV